MDNNNPVVPPVVPPAANPTPVAPQPVAPQVIPPTLPSSGGSKKMLMMVGLAFVVVVVLVGLGIFMYTRAQKSNPELQDVTGQNAQTLNNLSTDLKNVEIASPEAGFSTVDSDLNSL